MNPCARLFLLAAILLVGACAGRGERRLYDDLGGQAGIEAIAEDVLLRTADDPRIAAHFRNANIVRLHEKLVELICVEADGPCVYTGVSMVDSHAGRGIDDAHFNALVENLIASMEALKVPRRAQFRLLDRLAAMHADVVLH